MARTKEVREHQTIHAFAALNSWDWSGDPFSIWKLSAQPDKGCLCPVIATGPLVHILWFRQSNRPVAIVGQPYDYPGLDADLERFAKRVPVHVPPAPYASIHYPGACRFIAFTRPGVTVDWLPEQDEEFGRFAIDNSEWSKS